VRSAHVNEKNLNWCEKFDVQKWEWVWGLGTLKPYCQVYGWQEWVLQTRPLSVGVMPTEPSILKLVGIPFSKMPCHHTLLYKITSNTLQKQNHPSFMYNIWKLVAGKHAQTGKVDNRWVPYMWPCYP
jgi:hypothetical protein